MPDFAGGPEGPAVDDVRALREELDRTRQALQSTTERLRIAQAQILEAGRLGALGQLVAGVAHEMNNPLSSVIGYAQLVHQQLVKRPELAKQAGDLLPDVGHILAEAGRAVRIVRNLLMFARRPSVARSFQDIEFLCDQVVELRSYDQRLNGIDIKATYAPDLPAVFADGSQIQQALLNLVLNAEHAVAASATRRIELAVSAEPGCGAVLIEIRDSGEGISPETLERIFEPFFTTRRTGEGAGLGLSIAWSIVHDHGGQMWATSVPHERTSVFLRLPASSDDAAAKGAVVVLHEDPHVRAGLAATFVGWGFQTTQADTLGDVLAAGQPPALVVADPAVVHADPDQWAAAREQWGSRTAIVTPTVDLCDLRRAVLAALQADGPAE